MKRDEIKCYDVFCGIDVGKDEHCAVVLSSNGTKLLFRKVAQSEVELKTLFADVSALGRALVVVDQYAGFGALVVTCAHNAGLDIAHIPPKRFAQIAEIEGEGKTDALDAHTLANIPLEMPRRIDFVAEIKEEVEQARALIRYRCDLVGERTKTYNRVHDALNRCCPPLEQALTGSALHTRLALTLLSHFGPIGLRCARKCDVVRLVRNQKGLGQAAEQKALELHATARLQTISLPAASIHDQIIKAEAARIIELEERDEEISEQIAQLCSGIPDVENLRTMSGIGKVFSATIALEIGDISRFDSASKLAAYSGVGKCPKESGKKKGKKQRKNYNRTLNTALFESARIAIRKSGPDRDYFEKKLAESKNVHQALHALVRKRVSIIYAMLVKGEAYQAA